MGTVWCLQLQRLQQHQDAVRHQEKQVPSPYLAGTQQVPGQGNGYLAWYLVPSPYLQPLTAAVARAC
eukprot:3932007-Rhodomonas_salina.1